MAAAGSEPTRNLTREDVISQAFAKLQTVSAKVTREEVAEIVGGFGISGQYDQEAIQRAVAESLQLWSSRDQFGLLCTLRLNQEHLMDVQRDTIEKLELKNSNMKALIDEKVSEKMVELGNEMMMLVKSQQEGLAPSQGGYPGKGKQEKTEEGQHKESDATIMKRLEEQLEKKISEVERKLMQMIKEPESLGVGGGLAQKEKTAEADGDGLKTQQPEDAKEETEEEKRKREEKQKDDEVFGHLNSYDEAFKELQQNPERNDLASFKRLSERIMKTHDVVANVKELLPPLYFNPLERLGSSIKVNYQPFVSNLDELMTFHEDKKPAFDEKVMYVANETKGKAVIPKMKGRERCSAKALFKYTDETGTSWHRCTDIVRATILYDDIESMYDGLKLLDKLHQEGQMEIVEFNDRYQTPMPGNYRDLQLAVKIKGMVAELQLNTKAMAYVKENAGHRSFEVSRELIAAVKESDAQRCDAILLWGLEQVGEKSIQDILNDKKKPVLHEAARQGNADLMKVFIRYNADVNLQTADGQTAMHKAAAGGHERAAWLLICEGAKFLPDKKGKTPLIEGMLNLRVNPSNERIARCVSMLAQMCGSQEFEKLLERLEVFVRERLHQSSDLVTACKDSNFEKVDRLLREWADPDSRDMSGDLLPAIHVALHGGQREFAEERLPALCRLLEFRANVDAVAKDGKQTALEVVLRSPGPEAHLSAVVLIQHGASFKGEIVRENLSPWTSRQIQRAEIRELAQHFLTRSLFLCTHELVSVERAMWVKGSPLHALLLRGYDVAKRVGVDKEKRCQAAYGVAHLLGCHGHDLERSAFLSAECSRQEKDDTHVYVVYGAGGVGSICNGEYRRVREHDGKPVYKNVAGNAIIHFHDHDNRWKISLQEDVGSWYYMAPDVSAAHPPPGEWTTEGYTGGDADPAPVVSSYKVQEHLDRTQQLRYWVNLAAAAQSEVDRDNLIHAGVSCEALQESQAPAGVENVQLAAHIIAKRLRAEKCGKSADELLQTFNVEEDFRQITTVEDATETVTSISFNGDLFAAGGLDSKVRIYNVQQDFRLLKTLDDAANWIYAVAWSISAQLLAAGGRDEKVRVYDSEKDFQVIHTLDDESNVICCLAWSHELLATGSSDSKVRLYSMAQDFALVKTLEEATRQINCITWADGFLASGSGDKQVRIYSAKDFSLIKSLDQATDYIRCVAWSAHGLATGGDDRQVRIYNPSEEFRLVATLSEASDWICAVAWIQNLLGTGGKDQFVRIYDPAQEYAIVKIIKMPEIVTSITCFADQFAIASGQCIYLHDCAINYGSFDLEQLWDFAQPPEQQEERSPTSPSRRPAT